MDGPQPVDTTTGMIYKIYHFYLFNNYRKKAFSREIKGMWN